MYREGIDRQIASALKNGEHSKLAVWRAIKTEFVKFQTSSAKAELTDEKEFQIINKMVQQRRDSIEQYMNAQRLELVKAEQDELEILLNLLPSEPSEEDIHILIDEFASNQSRSLSIKDMREVMSWVKQKYPTANGGVISKIFKEKYV